LPVVTYWMPMGMVLRYSACTACARMEGSHNTVSCRLNRIGIGFPKKDLPSCMPVSDGSGQPLTMYMG
jgi:hypothetical protein